MARWIKQQYIPGCDLSIVWMDGWKRSFLYSDTRLPWILPSPNMPTQDTAIVYPGTVLAEGLNISEGRGTTRPFELLGAPFVDAEKLKNNLDSRKLSGCIFRIHNFIPAFNKFKGEYCNGLQIHVTDPEGYYPVGVALELFDAIIETADENALQFIPPPYEYEQTLMPFDILSGDSLMRETLMNRLPLSIEKERWKDEINEFRKELREISVYPEF